MPAQVDTLNIVATKQADGTVQILFQSPTGQIRFAAVMASADVTALNTNVNGGASGATATYSYAANANRTDYPSSSYFEV